FFSFCPEGDEDSELALEEGDVVRLVERVGDEWLRGELKGRQGIFPASFVEIIEDLPPGEETSPALSDPPGKTSKSDSTVKALYDFEDPPLGDLPFKEGDMIDVVEFIGEDWGRGLLNGKEGLFPLSFVAELEEVP
ncbi:hypothetical protein EGW08_013372, partial [Elysia chlorotica]